MDLLIYLYLWNVVEGNILFEQEEGTLWHWSLPHCTTAHKRVHHRSICHDDFFFHSYLIEKPDSYVTIFSKFYIKK